MFNTPKHIEDKINKLIVPGISKAQTEEKQLKELQKQTRSLDRIANALEKIGRE